MRMTATFGLDFGELQQVAEGGGQGRVALRDGCRGAALREGIAVVHRRQATAAACEIDLHSSMIRLPLRQLILRFDFYYRELICTNEASK